MTGPTPTEPTGPSQPAPSDPTPEDSTPEDSTPEDPTPENATSEDAAAGSRTPGGRRPRDMVLSMLVLLLPIALILLFFRFIGGNQEVTTVDPGPAIAKARQAGLAVLEPGKLPDGWRATSAVTRTKGGSVTLRIGYVSPTGGFAQVVESDADPPGLLRRELGGAKRPDGLERLDSGVWRSYPGRDDERALVLLDANRTVLVFGKAPDAELRTLAASLH